MEPYESTYDQICKSQDLGLVIFPGFLNFTAATTLCKNVNGKLFKSESQSQIDYALNLMSNSKICSNPSLYGSEGVWVGWWDQNIEGRWVSANNISQNLEEHFFQPWSPGEPNGKVAFFQYQL